MKMPTKSAQNIVERWDRYLEHYDDVAGIAVKATKNRHRSFINDQHLDGPSIPLHIDVVIDTKTGYVAKPLTPGDYY